MPGVKGTMHEFKAGKLHSGSKSGPVVKSRKQAIAIALSEGRKAGEVTKPARGKKRGAAMRRTFAPRGARSA